MKITAVKSLAFPEVKVIQYERFLDNRGYFSESFRRSDFKNNPQMEFVKNVEFLQCNESYSKKGAVRGLHFQWNPVMGKMVRTIFGHMVDLVLDIRKNSPTLGKIIAYDMPTTVDNNCGEWIWVPPGFAHGNVYFEDSMIEYFCTGEYSPGCEAGISPLAADIDWSLCDTELRKKFDLIASVTKLITEKDRNGLTVDEWKTAKNSDKFIFGKL